MTDIEMLNLVNVGATDRLRKRLKKLGIEERMKELNKCIPHIRKSNLYINFFKKSFSVEIGALITCNSDVDEAAKLYRQAIK